MRGKPWLASRDASAVPSRPIPIKPTGSFVFTYYDSIRAGCLSRLPAVISVLPDGIVHRHDVCRRCVDLHVVTRAYDVAPAVSKEGDILGHLPPHILGTAERQRELIVDSS